ncbi:MAG: hypothetical protein KDD22_05025 [Bdellovibrionales bacterium]|nr:hypothetical protein [Bdellovibrionales bacterium]
MKTSLIKQLTLLFVAFVGVSSFAESPLISEIDCDFLTDTSRLENQTDVSVKLPNYVNLLKESSRKFQCHEIKWNGEVFRSARYKTKLPGAKGYHTAQILDVFRETASKYKLMFTFDGDDDYRDLWQEQQGHLVYRAQSQDEETSKWISTKGYTYNPLDKEFSDYLIYSEKHNWPKVMD